MELIIILVIVCVPVGALILFGLAAMLSRKGQHGRGPAPNGEDLNQVLRDLSAGLERMEQRLDSVEEIIGASDANKN